MVPKLIEEVVGEIMIGIAFPHPSVNCTQEVNAQLSEVLIRPGKEDPGVTFAKLAIY
jgi:hypothetical protein